MQPDDLPMAMHHEIPPSQPDEFDPAPEYAQDEIPRPDHRIRPIRKTCLRVGATLAPLHHPIRKQVYAAMAASRHRRGRLSDQRRELVHTAVTEVATALARRQPGHPQIHILHLIRRRLEQDLGWTGGNHAA